MFCFRDFQIRSCKQSVGITPITFLFFRELNNQQNLLFSARPLLALFERLISNDAKSNTILTNAQILSILIKELDIDASTLHALEVDIYINIVKKFLKDWSQWDRFDRTMNRLKRRGSDDNIKNFLEQSYQELKEFLRAMIDIATPLANKAVKDIKDKVDHKSIRDNNDIILEVYCTRKLLNSFIYNKPNPAEHNSIFNLLPYKPMKLHPSAPTYTFSSLLNWYGVHLSIELPYFQYSRYTTHRLKHMLVNDKNGPRDLKEELDVAVYMNNNQNRTIVNNILIGCITTFLDILIAHYKDSIEFDMIKSVINVIKSDLELDSVTVEIPGSYKQHMNKYPYVRKLYSKVEGATPSPHNLYIEEKIIPIQDWDIRKFINNNNQKADLKVPALQNWLKFECGECKEKFNGAEFLTSLREHFRVYHVNEPDWTCVNCQKSFTMADITDKGWKHDC